jgi:sarcosine oxidase
MRVAVVGCGVIGLLTAVECVRAGAAVELIDSSGIPAPRATSNDTCRVVRALHRGDELLTTAAAEARRKWADLERMLGARFYHRTGVLTVMPEGSVRDSLAMLRAAGEAGHAVSEAELSSRYPQLRPAAGRAAVFEPAAGTVLAREALLALASWLGQRSAVSLHAARRVTGVSESGTVQLAHGSVLAADGIVVAAGPWSRGLLPATVAGDLILHRQTMLTYAPGPSWLGMPAVVGLGPGHDAWLMPPVAGEAARLSAASASRPAPAMTGSIAPDLWRDHLLDRFATLLTGFDSSQVTAASDGYYLSDPAGRGPRVAAIGEPAVWAYPACGGQSFKVAPLVAKVLADRALGRPPRTTGLESVIPGLASPRPRLTRDCDEAART